jgi:predicted GNAT superfamily acetyltransferase
MADPPASRPVAGLEIRELASLDDVTAASELIDRIWGQPRNAPPALLRALATHGGEVLGAFEGGRLVGTQVAFVGTAGDRLLLHSHITGVAPEVQHRGVGHALKVAQRRWCLDRGIDLVTWTFDPMVARNARFNLHKLGAVADRFHRDFYGEMEDELNRGDRSDRLEVRWDLRSPRVEAALASDLPEPDGSGAGTLLREDGVPAATPGTEADRLLVAIPPDYHGLRGADPEGAARWRAAVGDALEGMVGRGWVATGFLRSGAYVLERA